MPPDMQVEPPMRSCFSSTRALAPAASAASAATMPPPPDPTITRSTVVSHVVMSPSPTSRRPVVPRWSKLAGSVDDCYEAEVICRRQTRAERGKWSGGDDWSRKNADVPIRRTRSAEGPASGTARRLGASGRRRGVLGRRPHFVGRGHLLRAPARGRAGTGAAGHERRRRLGARHGREVDPRAGIRRGPHHVRPRARFAHGGRGGPARRARIRRGDQGARLPELRPRPLRLAGQGDA